MRKIFLRTFNIFVHVICIAALILLIYGSLKQYHDNKNSLNETFQRFQTNGSSVYPSMSMCFSSPFSKSKLEKRVNGLTPLHYSDFILGKSDYTEILANISYQDVSIDIKDFLISANVSSKSIDDFEHLTSIIDSIITTDLSVYTVRFLRCFTFNIPYVEDVIINMLVVEFNRTIFPEGKRPMNGWAEEFGLSLHYHLPNQLFKSYSTRKIMWPEEPLKLYTTFSYVANIEILRRRHISKGSCTDVKNYDEWFKKQIVSSVGCYPPYWNSSIDVPICDTKEKLIEVSKRQWDRFYGKIPTTPPCTTLQRIDVEYLDSEPWETDSNTSLYFPTFFRDVTYKNVKQVRAYSHSDMYGDIGGYVGLLLGYAIVQIPNLLWKLIAFLVSEEKSFGITMRKILGSKENNKGHIKDITVSEEQVSKDKHNFTGMV